MSTTAYDEFKHLRGAYVDCTFEVRDLAKGELPPGKGYFGKKPDITWQEGKEEGILGFTRDGYPKFDDEPHFNDPWRKYGNVRIVERFRPSKNSIRFLCRQCGGEARFRGETRSPLAVRVHPLAEALKAARIRIHSTYGSSYSCSACGSSGQSGILKVPPCFWWIRTDTPDEEIDKGLAHLAFDRLMKDATISLWLRDCQAQHYEGVTKYIFSWNGSHGEYLRSQSLEPPPAGW